MFQAYGGGVVSLVPGWTGVVAPNVHEVTTIGGRIPNWGNFNPDGPRIELLHAGEAGWTAKQRADVRLSFGEMGSIFQGVSPEEQQALVASYQLGSTTAEWGMDIALGKALTKIARPIARTITKTGTPALIKHIGSESAVGAGRIFKPIAAQVAPRWAPRVGGVLTDLATRPIFNPGYWTPAGSILEMSANIGTMGAFAGKYTVRGLRRATGKDFLGEIAEMSVLQPRVQMIQRKGVESIMEKGPGGKILSGFDYQPIRAPTFWDNVFIDRFRPVKLPERAILDVRKTTTGGPRATTGIVVDAPDQIFITTKAEGKPFTPEELAGRRKIEQVIKDRMAAEDTIMPSGWAGTRSEMDPIARFLTRTVEPRVRRAGQRIMTWEPDMRHSDFALGDTWSTGLQYGRRAWESAQEGGRRIGGRITQQYDNWSKRFFNKGMDSNARTSAKTADADAHVKLYQSQKSLFDIWKDLINKRKATTRDWMGIKIKDSLDTPLVKKNLESVVVEKPAYKPVSGEKYVPIAKRIDSVEISGIGKISDDIFPNIRRGDNLFDDTRKIIDDTEPKKFKRDDIQTIRRISDDLVPSGRPKRIKDLPIEYARKTDVPGLGRTDDLVPGHKRTMPDYQLQKIDNTFDDFHLGRKLDNYVDDLHFKKGDYGRKWDISKPWKGLGAAALVGASLLRGPGKGGGGGGARGMYAGRGRGHTLKRDIKDIKLFGTADFLSPKSMEGFFQPKTQPQITVKQQRPATSLRAMVKKGKGGAFY